MSLKTHSNQYLEELKDKWKKLQEAPNIFSYSLNISDKRFLPGESAIYVELNMQRSSLRRAPQMIPQLVTAFDAQKFNFTKIQDLEHLTHLKHEECDISIIINKSPLTLYHMLICPELREGHCQKLSLLALSFSVTFLHSLEAQHADFRIGYNSPGALASVNHLHLHLLYMDKNLYIDKAKLELLAGSYIYRLSEQMPSEAICFIFYKTDSNEEVRTKLNELYEFTNWLCENSMPHNLFMTLTRDGLFMDALKVFVFARTNFCQIKNPASFNVGFCELSGFITVGDREIFENLTENLVFERIRLECGSAYNSVYQYFKQREKLK